MSKLYFVTSAVNETNIHKGFWASIANFREHTGAELKIVGLKYRNPTAKRGKVKKLADDTYHAEVVPYLTNKEEKLGPNLTLFGNVPVQPTSSNPTSGLEVFCAGSSAIIGHVKRAMQVVPTEDRTPRVIWTTAACTLAKYSRSRAGAKAKRHHVIGGLIVKVERNGTFHVRNVTMNRDGGFTDLNTYYAPDGVYEAGRAWSVTAGDIHSGQDDAASRKGLKRLIEITSPRHLVLHDVLDMHTRSHHKKTKRDRYETITQTVEDEVLHACSDVADMAGWGPDDMEVDIVRSNHDEHFERWVEEFKPSEDAINLPYWHEISAAEYRHHKQTGRWPNLFELAFRTNHQCDPLGRGKRIRFLGREDTLVFANVEHAMHGDDGVNGSRGSIVAYTKLGVKLTIGHSHTPGIRDGVFQTGVTGSKRMGYNRKPSTWLHAHVVLGADGKRQLIVVLQGTFGDLN